MKTEEKLNMTMLCDFYELTMGNGYFQTGFKDRITYFDVYFRSVPDGGGFAIAAGLERRQDARSRESCPAGHRHDVCARLPHLRHEHGRAHRRAHDAPARA